MRVKIISDSTCDLSPALLERYDIAVTPLCVIKDGKGFHDGVDITPADIFAHVDGGGDLCSTSAVSQYEYGEMFARYANEYDAVVQITSARISPAAIRMPAPRRRSMRTSLWSIRRI